MRHRAFATIAIVAGLLGAAISASATSTPVIQFNNINPNDGVYADAYAGIYDGTVNGVQTQFICDDFLNDITNGQSWYANANTNNLSTNTEPVRYLGGLTGQFDSGEYYMSNPNLAPGSTMNGVTIPSGQGGGITQQEEYNMISWLVSQMFADQNNGDGNWASMAGAIWSIADDGWNNGSGGFSCSYLGNCNGDLNNGGTHSAQYYVGQALVFKDATNLPQYNIYTPFAGPNCGQTGQPSCNGQEFFAPASEPGLPILLSFTLLGCGLLGKRALATQRQAE